MLPWKGEKRKTEMETYGLPNALIKVDSSDFYVPFNVSEVSKVH